jgi:hypothetical protein
MKCSFDKSFTSRAGSKMLVDHRITIMGILLKNKQQILPKFFSMRG